MSIYAATATICPAPAENCSMLAKILCRLLMIYTAMFITIIPRCDGPI